MECERGGGAGFGDGGDVGVSFRRDVHVFCINAIRVYVSRAA